MTSWIWFAVTVNAMFIHHCEIWENIWNLIFQSSWNAHNITLVEDQGTRLPDYPRVPGHFSGTRNRLLRFSYYPEPTRTRVHYPEGTRRVTERLKGRYFLRKNIACFQKNLYISFIKKILAFKKNNSNLYFFLSNNSWHECNKNASEGSFLTDFLMILIPEYYPRVPDTRVPNVG